MSTKIFAVNRFLGLNLSENGSTGLKLGEASKAENFYITDDYKLKTRPGTAVVNTYQSGGSFRALWNGLLGESRWTFIFYLDGHASNLTMTAKARNPIAQTSGAEGSYLLNIHPDCPVKVFSFGDSVWIAGAHFKVPEYPCIYHISSDGS